MLVSSCVEQFELKHSLLVIARIRIMSKSMEDTRKLFIGNTHKGVFS